MIHQRQLTNLLFVLLFITTFMAVYGFLSKGKAASLVKVTISEDIDSSVIKGEVTNPKFWDNYPVLVIKTKNEPLPPQELYACGLDLNQFKLGTKLLFFRCHFGSLPTDSIAARQVITAIRSVHPHLLILLDRRSDEYLKSLRLKNDSDKLFYVLERELPLTIERYGVSYFFKLNESFRPMDVYIPRLEIPEVTQKYLIAEANSK